MVRIIASFLKGFFVSTFKRPERMPKPKTKDGKNKNYYLDKETITEISESAGLHQMSASSYLDFLIQKEKLNRNPMQEIQKIQKEKEIAQLKVKELEKKEKKLVNEAAKLHEWQQAKKAKKPQALKIIGLKILEKDFESAEHIAKTWSKMTGVPALELILEAKEKVERSGI